MVCYPISIEDQEGSSRPVARRERRRIHQMDNMAARQRGFTLIELLIVLAILGILVGIVAASVSGLPQTARRRSMTWERLTVSRAIDAYNAHNVASEDHPAILPRVATARILILEDVFAYDSDDSAAYESWLADHGDHIALFGRYLRSDTKYSYAWDANGADLIVCDEEGLSAEEIEAALAAPGRPLCLGE